MKWIFTVGVIRLQNTITCIFGKICVCDAIGSQLKKCDLTKLKRAFFAIVIFSKLCHAKRIISKSKRGIAFKFGSEVAVVELLCIDLHKWEQSVVRFFFFTKCKTIIMFFLVQTKKISLPPLTVKYKHTRGLCTRSWSQCSFAICLSMIAVILFSVLCRPTW